ncbi:hypothetical protein OIV83_000082 [Microbotryomycetes sp. JL201]|nr:hypothetical protein OIV83_000082 [Microbotryomycetes sp. JL201]
MHDSQVLRQLPSNIVNDYSRLQKLNSELSTTVKRSNHVTNLVPDPDVFDLSHELDLTLVSLDDICPPLSASRSGHLSTASTVIDLTLGSTLMSTPPRPPRDLESRASANEDEQKRISLAPIVVETAPTPRGTVRAGATEPRERSLVFPLAFDAGASISDEQDDSVGQTQEHFFAAIEDDSFGPQSRIAAPDATVAPIANGPTGSPLASSIPFPTHMSLSSVLGSQIASPPNPRSSIVSCTPTHTRPVTPSEVYSPAQHTRADIRHRDLRAQPSVATLFSWDLAHLPSPNSPREQPYKIGLMRLILPTIALGGGRGSGKYGDVYGPVERRMSRKTTCKSPRTCLESVEEDPSICRTKLNRARSVSWQSSDFVRGVSRRSSMLLRSMGLVSRESLPEEEVERLDEWVKVVLQ